MLVPTLLALVLAASQVFASPTPQGASTNGLLEKKNVHYGGCTKKLLRRPWYDILSIPSNRYISAANCVRHKLSKAEKTEYLNAELCLMRLPSKTKLPGAHSRFDDLVKAHQM